MSYLLTFKYCFPSFPSSSTIHLPIFVFSFPTVLPYPFVFFVVHSFILFGQCLYLVMFMLRIESPWKHNHLRGCEVGVPCLFRGPLAIKHCLWDCFRVMSTLHSFALDTRSKTQRSFRWQTVLLRRNIQAYISSAKAGHAWRISKDEFRSENAQF